MITTEGAVERMRELVQAKAPFLHQGRTIFGIDCIGNLVHGFRYEGDIPAYSEDPVNGELEVELHRVFGEPILYRHNLLDEPFTIKQLQELDVVSMQYRGPVRHVAVVVNHISFPGQLSIIHTDSAIGHVTEHILDQRWLRRIVGVWRP